MKSYQYERLIKSELEFVDPLNVDLSDAMTEEINSVYEKAKRLDEINELKHNLVNAKNEANNFTHHGDQNVTRAMYNIQANINVILNKLN